MTVSCPDCRSVFRVDPAKVPATGVRARCSVCGGIIVVSGGTGALRTPARTPVSAMATASYGGSAPSSVTASATPAFSAGAIAGNATARPLVASGPGPMISPASTPLAAVRPTPGGILGAVSPRNATPSAAPGMVPRPAPQASAEVAPAAPTPRRAINPFLNADPGQRAKRLARALVSDLVAYHPKKRDEGLAQGTLRQLFREEIKKSYEEYVDQVGKELAESTPHFQEALNDILASGQRIF